MGAESKLCMQPAGGLAVEKGCDQGLLVALGERAIIVGRETGCDLRLADAAVSRRHFRLAPATGKRWVIEDLGSCNGTFVNGERVKEGKARAGDAIAVGDTVLRLLADLEVVEALRSRMACVTERDGPTGACSRELFDMRLRTEVTLANRTGTLVSVALLEIDRTPESTVAGPSVLVRIMAAAAMPLWGFLRGNDVLARFEEGAFAALILDPSPNGAYLVAERMCSGVRFTPVEIDGRAMRITASIGLATDRGRRDLTPQEIIARARAELIKAQDAGGNCVSRWVPPVARRGIPAFSQDLSPTEMEPPRTTKVMRTDLLAGRPTMPPGCPSENER